MRKIVSLSVAMLVAYLCTTATAFAAKEGKRSSKKKSKVEIVEKESAYKKMTGRDSLSMDGLFNVICKTDTYYIEIPVKLIGREFLVVNRFQKVPMELNSAGGNRGLSYEEDAIRFELDDKYKNVIIRQNRVKPEVSKDDAVYSSVENNYIDPILTKVKIEAISPDSQSVVIKINDLFNGKDNCLNDVFNNINLGTPVKPDLSKIISIKAFDQNLTATSELTTKVTEARSSVNVTVVVSTTLALLSETPMMPREEINRIGYFSTPAIKYSDNQRAVERKRYITRWRLEPSDKEAYMNGKLVEPVKPIIFYIDPAMPKYLVPYIKEGILDWNKAFEKAGFLNAIQVNEYTDSIAAEGDDMKYSLFTHAASTIANAMGPSTIDPRTGEILEADIMWWHNVLSQIREWLMVQTSATFPAVRTLDIPDSIMGEAARFVASHEVGHSLGLRHNMRASAVYPTDSLRSASFVDKMGVTSSIMDYARYNYVAQPGDGVKISSPQIGIYDMLAIEWGYRWFPTEEEAKVKLEELLKKHNSPMYRFSEAQHARDAIDPRAMSEDLGDNAIEAARYGIANMKRTIPNVVEWTRNGDAVQTYDKAAKLFSQIIFQWRMYHYHVLANVGGIYLENTVIGDGLPTYTYVEKERQKDAVQFLLDELFTYPEWLFSSDITKYSYILLNTPVGTIEQHPHVSLYSQQNYIFWDMLNNDRIIRMLDNEFKNGKSAFTAAEMLDMLYNHIFAKTIGGKKLTVVERNVQKSFIDALITAAAKSEGIKVNTKLYEDNDLFAHNHSFCSCNDELMAERGLSSSPRILLTSTGQSARNSDAISLKRGTLLKVKKLLKGKINSTTDSTIRLHYEDVVMRIDEALGLND